MKEFNNWFRISFTFMGQIFEKTISLSQITFDEDVPDTWFYYDKITVKDETFDIEVWGTYDDDGNVRTSDVCFVDGCETLAAFGINISEDGDIFEQIDDIDVIESD